MLRTWGQSGNEEKRRNPEFHGHPVVRLLKKSIRLQPNNCVLRESSIHGSRNTVLCRISALLILHPTGLEQKNVRGLSRKPGDRLIRCWAQSGSEEKRRKPEFHGTAVVHLLKSSISLQPNSVCIGKAHFMEIENSLL